MEKNTSFPIEELSLFMRGFPYEHKPFINAHMELIAVPKHNIYFNLTDIHSLEDLQNKIISRLSRSCVKDVPSTVQYYLQAAVNAFLCTQFTADEFMEIYTYFGNNANAEWRQKFVKRGFDFTVIEELLESRKSTTHHLS